MNNMEILNTWKESTQKIFWGVIVIAVAGTFNTVYDYVSMVTGVMDQFASLLPGGLDKGMPSFLIGVKGAGVLVKMAIVVGYVLYLLGLTRFAAIQTDTSASANIMKVRTAVIILICCFVVSVVFGILFKLPGIGLLFTIVVWIVTLVAYFKMKNAFGVLMTSPAFSEQSQKGAKKLRFAAVCNIWVMLLPIIAVILVALFFLFVFSGMSSGGRSMDTIMYSGGVLLALMAVCAIILLFIALIYPFIGWYKIMKGGPGGESLVNEEWTSIVQEHIDNVQQVSEEQQTPDVQPYINANKSKVGIGIGVVALAALLIWLVPKIFDSKEITVEEEVAEEVEQEEEMVSTSEMVVFENGKLGPVQVGKPISKLPESVEWLYDHYEYKKIEHEGNDMDDPWTEEYYLFTKGGKEIFRANINENRVFSIRLLKGSSFIRTTDGITVGFSARGLIMIKRLDWTNYYDGEVFGTEGHYRYYINPDDLVRADIPKKNEDLKPDAKVIGIEYSVTLDESQPEPMVEEESEPQPETPNTQKSASRNEGVSNDAVSPNKGTGFHLEKVNNNGVREETPTSNKGTGFHLEKVDRVPNH